MVDLNVTEALVGVPSNAEGGVSLSVTDLGPLTLVQPFRGKNEVVSGLMRDGLGVGLSANLRSDVADAARVTWFGKDTWLVSGVAVDGAIAAYAALSDQSDGWAAVTLDGKGAADVLARLVPVDLRPVAFGVGAACRTDLGHVPIGLIRTAQDQFVVLCFRSMAQTMWHELCTALRAVAARKAG